MKLLLLLTLLFAGCTKEGQPVLSPKQVGEYGQAVHGIVQGGLEDYKQVEPLINK